MKALKDRNLVRLICEAVVNPSPLQDWLGLTQKEKSEKAGGNPFQFAIMEEMYLPTVCGSHRDLAEIFIWMLEPNKQRTGLNGGPSLFPERHFGKDVSHISLRDYIKLSTDYPVLMPLPDWLFFNPDIEQITWAFFDANQHCFDSAIDKVCSIVLHGMPLFEQLNDGSFKAIPFNHPDYVYISGKSFWDETSAAATKSAGRYPSWSEQYFFCCAHFAAYDSYFRREGRRGQYYSSSAENALRLELRKALGFSETHKSADELIARKAFPLVGIANEVLGRSCPGLFSDDEKSWPKQEAISVWLQKHRSLSKRQADAVALIATQSK